MYAPLEQLPQALASDPSSLPASQGLILEWREDLSHVLGQEQKERPRRRQTGKQGGMGLSQGSQAVR